MTQHYHSPPRDLQNQHTEKCSVYTRTCLALQWTLISCSSSSFCSTGLSVTSPHLCSESIFIPLHASGTTCVVSSILVCFFLGLLQLFTILLLPTPFSQPSAFRAQPWLLLHSWRWLTPLFTWPLPLGSVHHVWLPLWHPVLNISWPHTSFFTHIQFHYSIFNTLSVTLPPNLLVLVLL